MSWIRIEEPYQVSVKRASKLLVQMQTIRRNWVVFLFLAAVLLTPFVTHYDSVHQAKTQANSLRKNNIARCIATAPRAAYQIAFQYEAGSARTAAGNIVTGKKYDALANAGIATVAAPLGYEGSKDLVEVVYEKLPDGNLRARLTARAENLQRIGCAQAYR